MKLYTYDSEMVESPEERGERYRRYLLSERELWELDAELFGSNAPAIGNDEFVAQAVRVSKSGRLTSRRVGRHKSV